MSVLLLTQPQAPELFSGVLRALLPGVPIWERAEDAVAPAVEAVLAWRLKDGMAGRYPNLRLACATAAGVEKIIDAPDLPPGAQVMRIVDPLVNTGLAQYVLAVALRHLRALPLYEAQQRERQWKRSPIAAVRSKVAVLGTGAMGSVVVRLLGAVGFEARGWSRASAEPLASVLGASDIVVCALPLTVQTEGLLYAKAFAAMPRGGYLINIARGGHVVEADLIDAVRSGQLAGAALDVQRREPMPADDPLWSVPGITITPHIAAQPSTTTIAAQFVEGLRCVAEGSPPPQTIDRTRGY